MNYDSFATYETISSSALIVEVITVVCLLARYAISPLNSFIVYVYELLRSGLSINNASLKISKLSYPLKHKVIYRVVFKYRRTRLIAW
jgi:hypothetical protein